MVARKIRHRLPPAERRSQLVHIAVKIAAAKGLGRVVHADIARAAGVSVATAFLYFPDRKALLKAIVAEVDRYYRALARQQHDRQDIPPLQRIRNHVKFFDASIDTDPDYAIVWLEWSTLLRNEYGLWDDFLRFQEFIISTLTYTIRAAQKQGLVSASVVPRDSARLLTAGSYALTQLKFMKRSTAIVRRYIDQTLRMTLYPD